MLKLDIDVDKKHKWDARYKLLKTLAFNDAEYYLTNHGFHIRIPSVPSSEALRRLFGDDVRRIESDALRQKMGLGEFCDVLFHVKNGIPETKISVWEALAYVSRF